MYQMNHVSDYQEVKGEIKKDCRELNDALRSVSPM